MPGFRGESIMSQEKYLAELAQQALVQPIQTETLQARTELAAPTAEQIQAANQVFAQEEHEAQLVAGLLGMWTGAVVLNELAAPVAQKDCDEDEDQPQPGGSQ
jgi:hypothetical protein